MEGSEENIPFDIGVEKVKIELPVYTCSLYIAEISDPLSFVFVQHNDHIQYKRMLTKVKSSHVLY